VSVNSLNTHAWPDAALRSAPNLKARLRPKTLRCRDFFIRIEEDVDRLAKNWPSLSELPGPSNVRAYPFQCRDHLKAWLDTIGAAENVKPIFVSVTEKNGAPLMMIPLGIVRRGYLRVLTFLDSGVADYNAPILYPAVQRLVKRDIVALWNTICHAAPPFDVAVLEKVPERVGDLPNPFRALVPQRMTMSGHVMSLEGFRVEDVLSKHNLKKTRGKRRRLAEMGEVEFRTVADPSEIDRVFAAFVRQKSRRYMETLGHPGFDVPGQRDYYRALTERLMGCGVELAYMSVGGEILGASWSLICGGRYYFMMTSYESGPWATYSPGRLLLEDLIDHAHRAGMNAFDFGLGDEAYKAKWQAQELPLWHGLHPRTPAGRLYCLGVRAREALKRGLPPAIIRAAKFVLKGAQKRKG
jgi:CelD/BcsL family acetyltransferase involved in cellulose biosynthesis